MIDLTLTTSSKEHTMNNVGNAYNFNNRTAIVTGAGSGIGKEIALQLAACGANVVVADRADHRIQVADIIQQGGGQALAIEVDVANQTSVDAMTTATENAFGQIDILVHCAGIGVEKPFLETTLEEWNNIINIDLTGTFLCCQAAAKAMVKNRYGRIINLASTAGLRGGFHRAAYGAAKGGVVTLTKVMAVELACQGITVNALAPGAIETEMVAKMHSAETRRIYTNAIPAARYGTPAETASAVLFLASDQASYINGHVLAVDGGFLGAGLMGSSVNQP